jgi:hypothetical protein
MEKEFVPYEQALALKELGFDEPCIGFWWNNKDFTEPEFLLEYCEHVMDGNLKRPLYQQSFRWFREKRELHSTITSISQESWQWHITKPGESLGKLYDEDFYTYEETELECLKKLIEIIKEKK